MKNKTEERFNAYLPEKLIKYSKALMWNNKF